jgi:hypothetical protein
VSASWLHTPRPFRRARAVADDRESARLRLCQSTEQMPGACRDGEST